MAFSFTKSTPATGAIAIYELKERLKAAGWTVLSSGDATTYNSSGDQISSGSTGAGGLANTNAWFVIRSPAGAGAPQFSFQRVALNQYWRIKYSMSAGFSASSPSATRTPSASDEGILFGGGTDASPANNTLLSTDGAYRWNIAADDAAPYGWWAGGIPLGGGNATGGLVFDPLTQTEPTDGHAYATYACAGNAFASSNLTSETWAASSNLLASTYPHASPDSSHFMGYSALSWSIGTAVVLPNNISTNPVTAKDEIFPIVLARRATIASGGYKGIMTLMKWTGTERTTGDTLNVAGTRDRIIYRHVSLPWDGSIPSI